jgi:DNA-binding NarL/FixJ family response regulator
MSVSVVLIDDHQVVRDGLRFSLEPDDGLNVVAEAFDAQSARDAVRDHRPDVVILDLQMPGADGVLLCSQLLAQSPQSAIIVLTAHLSLRLARACLRNGARGYLLKETAGLDLPKTIRTVLGGAIVLDPAVTGLLQKSEKAPGALTMREIEVLDMMAQGCTNQEIADALSLSINTIKGYCKAVLEKLHCRNRIEAISVAHARKII